MCEKYGITFIGPKSHQIRALGNKVAARAIAEKAKVPMLPGSRGRVATYQEAVAVAEEIGYPMIIKAAAAAVAAHEGGE